MPEYVGRYCRILQFTEMREASDFCHTGWESGYCCNDLVLFEWKMEAEEENGMLHSKLGPCLQPLCSMCAPHENTWTSQEPNIIILKQQDKDKDGKIHSTNLGWGVFGILSRLTSSNFSPWGSPALGTVPMKMPQTGKNIEESDLKKKKKKVSLSLLTALH